MKGTENAEDTIRGTERGIDTTYRKRVVITCVSAIAIVAGSTAAALNGCGRANQEPAQSAIVATSATKATAAGKIAKREVARAITQEEVTTIVNDMGLPKSSKAKVEVSDRQVIVTEEVELADAVVAERAFDRAEELAESIDATRADTVTWVVDNGKGASAAVTVDADTSKVESAAPKDVGAKLNAAVGYAISDKAYEPVKGQVKAPNAGEVPKGGDGKELVTPAKGETTEVASRRPAEKADSSTSDTTKQAAEDGGNGNATNDSGSGGGSSSNTNSGSSNSNSSGSSYSNSSSGGSGGGSSEPQLHWVDEQGHYEDVYETQNVCVGQRWVVDTPAWDEPIYDSVLVYACNCGYETTDGDAYSEHGYQHLVNGDEWFGGGTYRRNDLVDTIHHGELGHNEDIYEPQQVTVGQRWVVDVPGHWE